VTPILLVGAGRMGGALIAGWRRTGFLGPSDLMIRDPAPGPEAASSGAILNPGREQIAQASTVVLTVKPQVWRAAAADLASGLAPDAIIVSICAGVGTPDLAAAFGGHAIARVMPTTAAAIGKGTASVFSADPAARMRAHALMEPVGTVVDLFDEDLMHAATAVSGSAPAYLYAFVEALEAAGRSLKLPPEAASTLARATICGAAALLEASGAEPADLRRQVASPGGTTEAALDKLTGPGGLPDLVLAAATAAERRSRELGS
jgi:pyrroline-5-carboxylate reductase